MLHSAAKRSLLAGMLLVTPVGAMSLTDTGAMPPPPGPYLSSRPQLELPETAQGNAIRMPFVGTVPPMPMPMRTMPTPNQFPVPPAWWRGPMGH